VSGDLFIGVSDYVRRRLTDVNRTPPKRTMRVYNGIRLERFQGEAGEVLPTALGLPPGTPVVFASGRANAYKGIPTLLEAWQRVETAGYPGVHAAYAGDGPALADFRAQAETLRLRRFHFLGRRDDVPALLRSAAVAVVPSVWDEAFGLTVAEGMAAGKPVVASAVGGVPELVEPGRTGLLVLPADPGALAVAIRHCLDHPDEAAAMGRRGREAAAEKFNITRVVDELSGLLANLYPAPGPGQ
jgi:glycosyltransferase involved in cell wall biosynthesis